MLQSIVKKHCKILLMLSALCVTHAFAPDGDNPLAEGNVELPSYDQSIPPEGDIWQKALDKATKNNPKQLEQFQRINEITAELIEQRLIEALGQVLSTYIFKAPRLMFVVKSQSLKENTDCHLRLLAADRALQMADSKNIKKEVLTEINSIRERFKSAFEFMKSAVLRQNKIEIAFTAEVYVLTEHMITGFADFCQSKFKTDASRERMLFNVDFYIPLSRHEEVDMLKFRLILTEFYNVWNTKYDKMLSYMRGNRSDDRINETIKLLTKHESHSKNFAELQEQKDLLNVNYEMLLKVFSSSPESAPDPAATNQAHSTGSSASSGASVPDPTSETASTETGSPESAASEQQSSVSDPAQATVA